MQRCKYCVYEDEGGEYINGKCICPSKLKKGQCIVNLGQPCTFYTI